MAFKRYRFKEDDELRTYTLTMSPRNGEIITPKGGIVDCENDVRLYCYGNGPYREPCDEYQFIFDYKGIALNVNIAEKIKGDDIYYKLLEIDKKEEVLITEEMKEALRDAIRFYGTVKYGEDVDIYVEISSTQKMNISEEEYPVIPKEQLRNGLTASRIVKTESGELMWEVTQKTSDGTKTYRFPERRKKIVNGQTLWYKFNPVMGTYSLNLRNTEPSLEEEPIGLYGQEWMRNMEANYSHLVTQLKYEHRYLTVARTVDREAENYRELLDSQYETEFPRPRTFEETLKWEKARMFHSENTVMREIVLKPRTE